MISTGMRSLENPSLDGNMFRQVTMYCTSDIIINFVKFLYGMEWKPHLVGWYIYHGLYYDHEMTDSDICGETVI